MVVLYSNHCVRCNIVKAKLDAAGVEYEVIDDIDWLTANGYDLMPVLEVDGEKYTNMTQMNAIITKLSTQVDGGQN